MQILIGVHNILDGGCFRHNFLENYSFGKSGKDLNITNLKNPNQDSNFLAKTIYTRIETEKNLTFIQEFCQQIKFLYAAY